VSPERILAVDRSAAVPALDMRRHRDALAGLRPTTDPLEAIEGRIGRVRGRSV
jgi:hypothetical protein